MPLLLSTSRCSSRRWAVLAASALTHPLHRPSPLNSQTACFQATPLGHHPPLPSSVSCAVWPLCTLRRSDAPPVRSTVAAIHRCHPPSAQPFVRSSRSPTPSAPSFATPYVPTSHWFVVNVSLIRWPMQSSDMSRPREPPADFAIRQSMVNPFTTMILIH